MQPWVGVARAALPLGSRTASSGAQAPTQGVKGPRSSASSGASRRLPPTNPRPHTKTHTMHTQTQSHTHTRSHTTNCRAHAARSRATGPRPAPASAAIAHRGAGAEAHALRGKEARQLGQRLLRLVPSSCLGQDLVKGGQAVVLHSGQTPGGVIKICSKRGRARQSGYPELGAPALSSIGERMARHPVQSVEANETILFLRLDPSPAGKKALAAAQTRRQWSKQYKHAIEPDWIEAVSTRKLSRQSTIAAHVLFFTRAAAHDDLELDARA